MAEVGMAPVRYAWAEQPEGARSALIRCVHEVANSQCGSSNIKDPAVVECMQLQVYEYKEKAEDKTAWLISKGCAAERATLRADEI